MKLKNISKETQLVDGVEIKAWAIFESVHAESILRNYSHIYEAVEENEEAVEETVEVKKPVKKASKK